MFYNAKNHTVTIDGDTTDFISFGKGKKNLVIIPGVGDGLKTAKMFATDTALISLAGKTVPVYFGAMWIFGIQMCAQTTFVGLGKAKISLFIALLRKVILLIPLALILPLFFGVDGIFWAEPIASMSSAITSGILLFFCYKKLK